MALEDGGLSGLVEIWARRSPARTAVIDDAGSATYAELCGAAQTYARILAAAEVAPGDRVGLALDPSAPYLAALLGIISAGAIAVPLNVRLTPSEMAVYLEPLELSALLVDDDRAWAAEGLVPVTFLPRVWQETSLARRVHLDRVVRRRVAPVARGGAMIFPTGGTTGTPKGALWSHRAAVRYVQQVAFCQRRRAEDRELCYSPFYHVGLLVGPIATLATGGVVRVMRAFDPDRAVAELGAGVSRLFGPPTMYSRLREAAGFSAASRDRVRGVMTGGASVTAAQLAALAEEFPAADITTAFAMTETGAVTELDHRDVIETKRTGVGRALAGVEITVIGADGQALERGESGELVISTPWQADGYWGRPDASHATWTARGIRTGDIGTLDDAGWLIVRGRAKEMIKSGGENVFPLEVEGVLMEHPAVELAVAYGVADKIWGERVEVAVLVRAGKPEPDELRRFCRERLAGFKVPKRFRLVDAIPMTTTNKPDRRTLVADALGAADAVR